MKNPSLTAYLDSLAERLEGLTPEELEEELDNALDASTITNLQGDVLGYRIMLTCGGPNVWLDTDLHLLIGAWGTELETRRVSGDLCSIINDGI